MSDLVSSMAAIGAEAVGRLPCRWQAGNDPKRSFSASEKTSKAALESAVIFLWYQAGINWKTHMWDERYSSEQYAYGTNPNDFLEANVNYLPKGKVLSLAEGEGRNAVFLAKRGYSVTAVDASLVGLNKARNLAEESGVDIELIHADLADYDLGENKWDGIVSIFCALPSSLRKGLYKKVQAGLKRNGVFLLEAYTPNQLRHGTGGGNSVDAMQSKESLSLELRGLQFKHLIELERSVIEGDYHTGIGAVVQAIATKDI